MRAVWLATVASGKVWDLEIDGGAVPEASDSETQWANGAALNATLTKLQPNDILVIPNKTYHLMGGIQAAGLESVVFQLEGTLSFSTDTKNWPTKDGSRVHECFYLENVENVTFTSSGKGTFEGNGATWWGIPGVGYLERAENRPKLFEIANSRNILVENLLFHNSPYWTFWVHGVDGLEVRHTDIDVRRTTEDSHSVIDLTAFNTDGFDVTGKNVWIHDCNVWNQDDCIAVKDNAENMIFERINASGVGLTIGSIGGTTVRNITFRDCHMHHTYKGIYMKFRDSDQPGVIEDILYENIVIDEPSQWAIWMGPAQQSDSRSLCAAHPCSICWPTLPGAQCNAPVSGSYRNITLRNVVVNNPKTSPGVLLGNSSNPMQNVVFDGVKINNPGQKPWGDSFYKCDAIEGVAMGGTFPVPPCFKDANQVLV